MVNFSPHVLNVAFGYYIVSRCVIQCYYSETLEEISVQFGEVGDRSMESAAAYLEGQALEDFRRVVENYVKSSISAQEQRFHSHQWSHRLLKEEAALRNKLVCTLGTILAYDVIRRRHENLGMRHYIHAFSEVGGISQFS